MRMIPASPYRTESNAEKKIFDRLRESFASDSEIVAFHSLNLTNHEYKRFGEIDFLICSRFGIFVLEVKGGQVRCRNGNWEFINRFGDRNSKREGPFKQAETALHGLRSKLIEKLPKTVVDEFCVGYGVVLPDCKLSVEGMEWDPQTLCDGGAHRDIEGWMKRLFRYWREKDREERRATNESLRQVVKILRPDFEAVVPLHSYAESATDEIHRLTESQMKLVDAVELNDRVVCEGGAGTGKTFLAVELARRWTGQGLRVALVCYSTWLKNYLQEKNVSPNLYVSTVRGLRTTLHRNSLNSFDALIIDEGQDLLTLEELDILSDSVLGGLESGKWCFFLDINNQSGLFGEVEKEAIEYLQELSPLRIPLKTNCRNTNLILQKIKTTIGADMGIEGAGAGPEVRETDASNLDELGDILDKEISELVNVGGLSEQQVTILTDDDFIPFVVEAFSPKLSRRVQRLDEYSIRKFPPQSISVASVSSFKGLENDVVLFISPSHDLTVNRNISYVAMSRAKAVLSIVYLRS